jgi:hypothetical protein
MTKKIMTYSIFEGKTEDYKVEEFKKALDSPEGKDFQRWFGFNSVRTGRSYISKKNEIKEINIPSRSYFDFNGDRWYYEFSSSNGLYGTTYNQDLKSLFRIFMVDSVRKSRPASITEKQIKEFFSKESNFPKGNFPDPEKIYSLIIAESGFITDFSFLEELPIIKRISDLGIPVSIRNKKGTKSIDIDFSGRSEISTASSRDKASTVIIEKIFGKEYSDSLNEIIEKIPSTIFSKWKIRLFESLQSLEIEPKSEPGKKVYKGRTETVLRLGFDSKEKIEEQTEKFIKERITLIRATLMRGYNEKSYINPLTKLIEKKILGESIEGLEKESKEKIDEILLDLIGPEIEKNPLDLYILDGFPELKKKVMERYGIEKDFSKIGKAFGKGFL